MTMLTAAVALVGTGLCLWALTFMWPPLALLMGGAILLRVAWTLDGGEEP